MGRDRMTKVETGDKGERRLQGEVPRTVPFLDHVLERETALSPGQIAVAIFEYKRFTRLLADHDGSGPAIVPSPFLAEVWRYHRGDILAYRKFCDVEFGRFLGPPEERPPQENDPAYAATLARYASVFGETANPMIWPSPAALRRRRWSGQLVLAAVIALCAGLLMDWDGMTTGGLFAACLMIALALRRGVGWTVGVRDVGEV